MLPPHNQQVGLVVFLKGALSLCWKCLEGSVSGSFCPTCSAHHNGFLQQFHVLQVVQQKCALDTLPVGTMFLYTGSAATSLHMEQGGPPLLYSSVRSSCQSNGAVVWLSISNELN